MLIKYDTFLLIYIFKTNLSKKKILKRKRKIMTLNKRKKKKSLITCAKAHVMRHVCVYINITFFYIYLVIKITVNMI